MLGFVKIAFAIIATFFNLPYVNFLECVTMKNQECKARPKIINVNTNEPVFYPYSIKVNKCGGSCNNIIDPFAKLCVPDIIKNINVKAFNLMPTINETRHIIWHETFKCVCRLTSSICNSRKIWNEDKFRCECREDLIHKVICNKGFIWNPSNCGCECDKSCGTGECLDYKSSVCRKSIVDKLIEECTNVIDEKNFYNENLSVTPLDEIPSDDCTFCMLYVALFAVFLAKSVIIGGVFLYFYWYSKKDIIRQYLNKDNVSVKFNPFRKTNY